MKKIGLLLVIIVTMVLEALPMGAVLVFAPSAAERSRELFSYFDPTLLGYANFAPVVTAILTCIVLVLVVLSFKNERFLTYVFKFSLTASIVSSFPLTYGIDYFSIVGGIITGLLLVEGVLAKRSPQVKTNEEEDD